MDNSLSDTARGSTQGRSPVGELRWNERERWLQRDRTALLRRSAADHVDLADVVRLVVADRAGPHRASLAETHLEPATVVADEVRVRVILRALLGWLERHARPGSRIRASVMHRHGEGVVELLVRGPGPSRAELEAALAGGTSVGDPVLARRLCLAEGGQLGTLDRAGPERGFQLTFPAA